MKNNRHNEAPDGRGANPAGTARDREMGRDVEPLGDRGRGNETWTPPPGEQGISNRPDDEGVESAEARELADGDELEENGELDEFDEDIGVEEDEDERTSGT